MRPRLVVMRILLCISTILESSAVTIPRESEEIDPRLIWKLQLKFLEKAGRQLDKLSRDKSTTGNIQCEFHPQ